MTTGPCMRRRRRTARLSAVLAVLVGGGLASVAISACGGSSSNSTTTTAIVSTKTSAAASTASTPAQPGAASIAPAEPDSPVAGVEVISSNLQLALQQAGYAPGSVSGGFTAELGRGLRSFQAAKDLAAGERGALGPATAAALSGGSAAVIALQSALTDVDLFHATIDGSYDAATLASVKALQHRAGITADGFYGPQTAAELTKLYSHDDPEPVDDAYTGVEETAGAGTSTAPAATNPSSSTTSSSATLPVPVDTDVPLLKLGSTGRAVTKLQERLTVLGYRPGPADGSFGAATASAVLAFQKREGLSRDSVVGPSVEAVLAAPKAAGPPSGPAPRIDIDIARQLVFVVLRSGQLITLNSSTGNSEHYSVPGGGSDVAYTPVGKFTVIRKIPGDHHAPLGTLRSPLFFYRGWAIHGAANVPAYPASHGCARISNADADWLYPQVALGEPVVVFDNIGKSPGVDNAPPGAAPGY